MHGTEQAHPALAWAAADSEDADKYTSAHTEEDNAQRSDHAEVEADEPGPHTPQGTYTRYDIQAEADTRHRAAAADTHMDGTPNHPAWGVVHSAPADQVDRQSAEAAARRQQESHSAAWDCQHSKGRGRQRQIFVFAHPGGWLQIHKVHTDDSTLTAQVNSTH